VIEYFLEKGISELR
jgi:hypothetical protein